jgi:hexosaminidase
MGPQDLRIVISGDASRAPGGFKAVLGSQLAAPRARAILAQLRRQYGDVLPAMEIEDSPAFATRGVMLDISRDRVPMMEHLLHFVDTMSTLGLNHLQLYTEHAFAYAGHEEVWRGRDPMTPAEVRELDTYCRLRGVELAANQNCFGHLASWLRHPRYAPLAETHGDWEFEYAGERFQRSGPFSLCPTDPASLRLVEDLLGQLLPCFSGGLVNIGCDETFDVGAGRSADAVRETGRAAVCVEFTRRVCDIARTHCRRPMFWADIALHSPRSAGRLGDAIALIWDYEPGYPWAERIASLRAQGLETWVCPGTSCWRSITGRTTERRANLREAAAGGLSAGATGFMVTQWGDTGHHQQWPITLHALAEAADAAWTGGREVCSPAAASLQVLDDPSLRLGGWLDELGDADLRLRQIAGRTAGQPRRLRNATALFVDLHTPLREGGADPRVSGGLANAGPAMWREVLAKLESLTAARPLHADVRVSAELRHTLDVATFAARRALLRREAGGISRDNLLDDAARIRGEFAGLWPARSRTGGLASSLRHYDTMIEDLQGAAP